MRCQALTLALALSLALLLGAAGCSSTADAPPTAESALGYYAQSLRGHVDLLWRARPVDDWLADPATDAALRERLALAQQLRRFAVDELGLPDNASYTRYADLGRSAVVWNVVAAPELSLTLQTWCYPVLGCAGYRGYFDRHAAEAQATLLRQHGLDVRVYGVPAYSTLGWSNPLGGDPLLNTFVQGSEAALAQLVFHELAHQRVYASGDTRFNESYATAVERLGLARWQALAGSPAARDGQRLRPLAEPPAADAAQREDFRRLTQQARAQLQALYASGADAATLRAGKARVLAELRAQHAALKAGAWRGDARYDRWFAQVNNAALALQLAYDGLVPAFERLFDAEGRDFRRFHAAVQRLADLPAAERLQALQALQVFSPASAR